MALRSSWPATASTLRVPFVPTPMPVAEAMLTLAGTTSRDRVLDLGSGDGRILILAARRFDAQAVGVEKDPRLAALSTRRLAASGVTDRARIVHADFRGIDPSSATVVTMYLTPEANRVVAALLAARCSPHTRIVAHDYPIPGWRPRAVQRILGRILYLYRIPHKASECAGSASGPTRHPASE